MRLSRNKRISDAFFVLGSQYYAVARHAAEELVSPLAGTLYHHAIEMLLKGALAKQMSSRKLKALSHDLVKLWRAHKSMHPQANLTQHDLTIKTIDCFEKIRYPDSIVDNGMMVGISIGGHGPALVDQFPEKVPKYKISTDDLDNIIHVIFESSDTSSSEYLRQIPEIYRNLFPPILLAGDGDSEQQISL